MFWGVRFRLAMENLDPYFFVFHRVELFLRFKAAIHECERFDDVAIIESRT